MKTQQSATAVFKGIVAGRGRGEGEGFLGGGVGMRNG